MVTIAIGVSGCSTITPLNPAPSPNAPSALIPQNTPLFTKTPIVRSTVSPNEARENLKHLLQTNGNCSFPCFWRIQPDRTEYDELYDIFYQLGGIGTDTIKGDHLYVSSTFRFEEKGGLYVELQAGLQNDIVRNVVVTIDGLWRPEILSGDWSAYTIDEVLGVYGPPTSVEIYLDLPNNILAFGLRLKYEALDTSILYDGSDVLGAENLNSENAIICPQFNVSDIKLNFGKEPINEEPNGVLLSDATDLDTQALYQLFTDNPAACLTVNRAAMGWGK